MKIHIILNTDGFLGAWSTRPTENSQEFEIPNQDVGLFHKTIDCRDGIEVLSKKTKKFDVEFGNLKLKFNDAQDKKLFKKTKDAHKRNKKKNYIEKVIYV